VEVPTVLVDGRNVLRSQWPNIPEDELVRLACEWAARNDVRAVVVFDGQAPAGHEGGHCSVVGTAGESADEWLIRRAAELRANGERFWLVTSDRALRDVAGDGAERTIGGGSFANELRPERGGYRSKRVDRSIQTEHGQSPRS
jgi:predicted RNA-binding protein with PIN domain